ncbi:MAG: AAA family ATPase, partial [Bacteroidales bacterium]|nr:AAA family ATPase [Bacteroidales bacterium]
YPKPLAALLLTAETLTTPIDMSEYQERHSVSRLVGAPPGYVGYDEGGQLTEAVRRKPYSVVLLDEIEKAHPDVFNILLQVLDDGRLTDNKGRTVDFKNTILIMTSNVGAEVIQSYMDRLPNDENSDKREAMLSDCRRDVVEILKQTVRPEFLNRIDEVIMFEPLSVNDIREILYLQENDLRERLAATGISISFTPEFEDYMVEKGYEPAYGARPIKRVMQRELVNLLAKAVLEGTVHRDSTIEVSVADGQISVADKK